MEKENKDIEKIEKQRNRSRRLNVILIIIIILLLMFYLLVYRLGKIGYWYKETTVQPEQTTDENPGNISNSNDSIVKIEVTQDDLEITKDTQLDIFNNSKFNGEKIIAPQSQGTYQFCVKNESNQDIIYNIRFADEMQNFVNMKYRLKIDNIYVRGDKNNYVKISDLDIENITVLEDSINIYTLEWYWDDDDERDTYVGSQETDQYYTLTLNIDASKFEK